MNQRVAAVEQAEQGRQQAASSSPTPKAAPKPPAQTRNTEDEGMGDGDGDNEEEGPDWALVLGDTGRAALTPEGRAMGSLLTSPPPWTPSEMPLMALSTSKRSPEPLPPEKTR